MHQHLKVSTAFLVLKSETKRDVISAPNFEPFKLKLQYNVNVIFEK